jgi:glycosyltransferase involved in cell wall biosynthesis
LKYFESGVYGVPTVASDMPAFDRDIEDGVNGFLCRDTDAWYGKIKRLLLDDDLRRRMGAEARARVLAEYTTESRAADLGAILAEIPCAPKIPVRAAEMRARNDRRS